VTDPPARRPSLRPARRLRIAGAVVLAAGLAGAPLFYWAETRSRAQTIDELLPGYSQARARQTGILMGSFVATLLGFADALKDPETQAIIIAVVSAIVALVCFRVAKLMDRPHLQGPNSAGH
jgi:hypothetical protein